MFKKLVKRLIFISILMTLTFITACKELDVIYKVASLLSIALITFGLPHVRILLNKRGELI